MQGVLNIDGYTTQTELSSVDGYDRDTYRHVGIDLSGGFNNATMICQTILKLPTLGQVQEAWREQNEGYRIMEPGNYEEESVYENAQID